MKPGTLIFLVIIFAFGIRSVAINTLPLSLNFDEAPNGIDAYYLIRLAWLTPFLQNQSGRETLFFYLQGMALWFYGNSIFSLRFVSVVLGTLTIPLLYVVGQRLVVTELHFVPKNPSGIREVYDFRGRWIGLLAAAGLAVSYWHLFYSRLALRAISLPPLLLALIWCFWRGWFGDGTSRRRRLWLTLAGVLMGVGAYTYLAGRLLPVLFGLFVLIDLARNKIGRREKVINFLLFTLVTGAVVTPLAVYFLQNPQAFYGRAKDVSALTINELPWTLAANLINLLKVHFLGVVRLGQWPGLDLVSAVGFGVGLLLCIYHWTKPAAIFLLLWWAIGSAPVVLTLQNWERQTTILRGIAGWPAIYLISAVGLVALLKLWVNAVRVTSSPFSWLYGLFLVVLTVGGGHTVYNYFLVWATTYNETDDRPSHFAAYLNHQTTQQTLIPLQLYTNPVLYFLLQANYPTWVNIEPIRLRTLLESNPAGAYLLPNANFDPTFFVLLVPGPSRSGSAYLLPRLTSTQIEALYHDSDTSLPLLDLTGSSGETLARIYPLAADAPFLPNVLPAENPIRVNFDNQLVLSGYYIEPAVVKPGETAKLISMWQASRPIDGHYFIFLHLFDIQHRQRWGQINTHLIGAARWPIGVTVPRIDEFRLPADAPAGPYRLEVGIYHAASLDRLPIRGPMGLPVDDKVILGKLQVWRQPRPSPQYPAAEARFGGIVELLGIDLPATPLRPGQTLTYSLHWRAMAPIAQDYIVFNHLLNAAGELKVGQDNFPQKNQYPTSWWDSGETVIDSYSLNLPPDLPPGRYSLRVGLYLLETGRRLPLNGGPQDYFDLPVAITVHN